MVEALSWYAHWTEWWDGATSNQICRPIINLIATINLQILINLCKNYIKIYIKIYINI